MVFATLNLLKEEVLLPDSVWLLVTETGESETADKRGNYCKIKRGNQLLTHYYNLLYLMAYEKP